MHPKERRIEMAKYKVEIEIDYEEIPNPLRSTSFNMEKAKGEIHEAVEEALGVRGLNHKILFLSQVRAKRPK